MKAEIFLLFLLIVVCFGRNLNRWKRNTFPSPCKLDPNAGNGGHEIIECVNITSFEPLSKRNSTANVYVISIRNSNISTLFESQFSQFSTLELIELTNSHLTTIEEGVFDGLNLWRLYLSHNDLTSDRVAKGAFGSLRRLVKFDLSHNQLTRLERSWFVNLTKLEELDLRNNNISVIAHDLFLANVDLEILNLYANPLVKFNEGLPKKISTVNLKDCGLDNANFSLVVDKVDEINLSHNEITILDDPPIWGKSREKIEKVDLSLNQISTIHVNYFEGLNNCRILHLHNNRITTINPRLFRDLGKLTELSLGSNKIERLCDGTFDGLTELWYLDVSSNRLLVLNENALSPLVNLENLNFRNNSISKLNAEKILRDFKKLEFVSLNYNRWRCEDARHIYETFTKARGDYCMDNRANDVENVHGIACTRHNALEIFQKLFNL